MQLEKTASPMYRLPLSISTLGGYQSLGKSLVKIQILDSYYRDTENKAGLEIIFFEYLKENETLLYSIKYT